MGGRSYNSWSVEEIEFLKENYKNLDISTLVYNLNHTKDSIRWKAGELNLTQNRLWNSEEIEYLKDNYRNLDINTLVDNLNHNKDSIYVKASALNLTKEWAKEEIGFLKNNYASSDVDFLKFNLNNHSLDAIREKAFLLGLKRNISGENSANWKNGASFKPYCSKFNEEFKEKIRDQFGRQCFICGLSEELNGKKLPVHHINYNKDCLCGDSKCYFVPLCNSCHSRTNNNRRFWEKLLIVCYEDPYMMEYFY